jgi:AbrB family looped-hinge helix DNA binding protein
VEATQSKVTSKGQIVIPKKIRKKYGITPQTVVHWVEKDDGIMMVPDVEDPIESARGMFKRSGLLDKLLEAKRVERMLENGKRGRS